MYHFLFGVLVVTVAASLTAGDVNFYFLRHGKTWANAAGLAQGTLDDERAQLTPEGIDSAKKSAKVFSGYLSANNFKVDRMFVSPVMRTRQTAEIFLEEFDPEDKDFSSSIFGPIAWGELEGQSFNTIVPDIGHTAADYSYLNKDWKPATSLEFPQSESVNVVAQRAFQGVSEIYSRLMSIDSEKKWNVVVVTHCDIIQPLFEHATGKISNDIRNCKVFHLRMTKIDEVTGLPHLLFIQKI